MMINKRQSKSFNCLLKLFVVLIMLTGVGLVYSPVHAKAETPSTGNALQAYCESHLPSKIRREACQDTNELQRVRNAASAQCVGQSVKNGDMDKCITSKGETYMSGAAHGVSTYAEYVSKLEAKLSSVGNPDQATEESQHGISDQTFSTGNTVGKYKCGDDPATYTSIDFGCKGVGNPILDAIFAIIRILSDGAALVLIGSLIFGGIQYTMSRGDPQSTAMAVNRIRSVLFSLLIFIFAYAILNYLIPGNILK